MRHLAATAATPLRPEQGLRLGGRYELRSRIAVGGMGEVWLSRDLSLERSVATKVLRAEFAGDDRFLARLRAEARTSAPLTHPNIAALYDYGEEAGSGYLVMELVRGETLSQLLEQEHVLAPESLLPVLAQTARALHAAHVCGIVHRDVKPSNILLTPDGRVKITDFGISGPCTSTRSTRETVLGTAPYISPEQAVGLPATPASDLYALGVVAYEALAGRRPFTGTRPLEIARAHVNDPVPPLPSSVPEPVRDLVLRMLAKHPERRPRSAASLARSFDRVAAELALARPFDVEPASAAEATAGEHARVDVGHLDTIPLDAADVETDDPPTDDEARDGTPPKTGAEPETDAGGRGPDEGVGPDHDRHLAPARRPRRAWIWLVLAVVVLLAITTALVLGAGRLSQAVEDGAVGGTTDGREVVDAASSASSRGDRAAGVVPPHLTRIEVDSW